MSWDMEASLTHFLWVHDPNHHTHSLVSFILSDMEDVPEHFDRDLTLPPGLGHPGIVLAPKQKWNTSGPKKVSIVN